MAARSGAAGGSPSEPSAGSGSSSSSPKGRVDCPRTPWTCGPNRPSASWPCPSCRGGPADLLGVPLVVELQQAGEDFAAGRLADREPGALLGLVEAVAEVEVVPAVGGGDGFVHLDVEVAELLDVGGGFVGVVEAIVGLGQALLAGEHDLRR